MHQVFVAEVAVAKAFFVYRLSAYRYKYASAKTIQAAGGEECIELVIELLHLFRWRIDRELWKLSCYNRVWLPFAFKVEKSSCCQK